MRREVRSAWMPLCAHTSLGRLAPASPPPRESKAERSIAEMCLGAGHPLVRLLGRSEVASEQLVSVTAVQAAGVVFLCAGRVSGSSLAIAAAVVPVALSCRVAALKSLRHNLCLELIVEGGASLPLPASSGWASVSSIAGRWSSWWDRSRKWCN